MATNFEKWEKDPFFSAAEEVQNSADRMESVYRKWMRDRRDGDARELQQELQTALGTTKWQLDEFQRAVGSRLTEDARARHLQFMTAIDDQVLRTERSLRDLVLKDGETELRWVRLDAEERDELALFLSGSSPDSSTRKDDEGSSMQSLSETVVDFSKNSSDSVELDVNGSRLENSHGHRRTLSANADIGHWKIAITDDEQLQLPPPRVPSLSNIIRSAKVKSKLQIPRNGFTKWKALDPPTSEADFLQPHVLSEGSDTCYEKGRDHCLDNCSDGSYDKHIDGWIGTIQRQIQRLQYQIRYNRSVQTTFSVALLIFFIVIVRAL